ncbi:MAG TPA: hypothetical protein DIC52_05315, partial [Candidatus Latescibacteria bacterium]|nr:hypothetical protein [Candidatus Latescibacterota bacterium]
MGGSAATDSTGHGRTPVHRIPVPRSAESSRCGVCTARSFACRWYHQREEDRRAGRSGLRW